MREDEQRAGRLRARQRRRKGERPAEKAAAGEGGVAGHAPRLTVARRRRPRAVNLAGGT